MATTNDRSLFAGQLDDGACAAVWKEVAHDRSFSNYSVAALSPHHQSEGLLALGNIHGAIKFLKLNEEGKVSDFDCDLTLVRYVCVYVCGLTGVVLGSLLVRPYCGKVFSLNWTPSRGVCDSEDVLFSCGPDGEVVG